MTSSVLIGIPCLKSGGTEMQTLRLVEALTAGGYHCVTVCYFEYDFPIVQLFEKAGSRVVCLSAYGRRPAGNREVYKFLKEGLRRVVEEYRPKIAHVQYMAPGAMPIIILKRLGIKNIIATLHTDASIYKNLFLLRILQKHKVTVFTCVTEVAEKSFFGSSSLYNDNVKLSKHDHFTIHNCLAPNINIVSDGEKIPQLTIGIVARLETIKGVDIIMPAFAKVLSKFPECKLLIVGDGKERAKMEKQQKEYGISENNVEWTGRVEYSKLPELYKRMSFVWVPSRSEGFGLSAIEAMAQGRTVIASATGGLNEIVHNDVDGVLFENGSSEDLAEKTIELLNNPEKMEALCTNAIQNAKQFSFERYSTSILSLYSKIV